MPRRTITFTTNAVRRVTSLPKCSNAKRIRKSPQKATSFRSELFFTCYWRATISSKGRTRKKSSRKTSHLSSISAVWRKRAWINTPSTFCRRCLRFSLKTVWVRVSAYNTNSLDAKSSMRNLKCLQHQLQEINKLISYDSSILLLLPYIFFAILIILILSLNEYLLQINYILLLIDSLI